MANLLGIAQATYNNWVNKNCVINPKYYPVIAKVCEVELSSLIPPDASIRIESKSFETIETNALALYQKFNETLEEQILMLKREVRRLQAELEEKNKIIEELRGSMV